MNTSDIHTIFEYHYWATRRVVAASAHVRQEHWLAAAAHSFGSLRGTHVHLLDADCAWRMLLQHQTLAYFRVLKDEAFPTIDVLVQHWDAQEAAMRGYLAQLTDTALAAVVCYTTPEGERRERVVWHCLLHVVNHGTQHRSEAAALLTQYGHSPGALDFTAFLNEQS